MTDNIVDQISNKIDENLHEIRIGLCMLGLVGLGVSIRSIKPFTIFSSLNDIPKSFIERNIKLNGRVICIKSEITNTTTHEHERVHQWNIAQDREPTDRDISILVQHVPIFNSKWSTQTSPGPSSNLSLSINSVAIQKEGSLSILGDILLNKNISFVILDSYDDNSMSCIVYCQAKKNRLNLKNDNLGYYLIENGLATVTPYNEQLENNKKYIKYFKQLLKLENKAENKQVGIWKPDMTFNNKKSIWNKININLGNWKRKF